MKQWRSRVTILAVGICIFVLPGLSNVPADAKPSKDAIQAGMTFPDVKFSKPASTKDQQSLGLEKNESFTLSQLPSKFVLIEVMSST
jgi:hypothetical protein